ncbi:MAG: CusA/CzcA family heavy metal efflux RND transporter [Gemmataceae bacterium]|nr:CusA/CzcA family heavy metal efflux RND transporter [Gemmataceae bacterium]
MLNWIIDASLRGRFLVLLGAVGFAAAGALAVTRLDVDAFPDTTPVQVQINTTAPSLGPEEVETQITFPVEQALGGLPRVKGLRSVSKFGLSQVVVTFEDGTDIYLARQLVTERLNAVELPAGVPRPRLGPVSTGLGEVFHYTVTIKNWDYGSASDAERVEKLTYLRTVHDWSIRPALRTVPGVAEVNAWGGYEKQYQVRPDPDRLFKHGLTFADVVDALERNNQNVGGGGVTRGNQFLLVHGLARTADLAQIRGVVVSAKDGVPVTVGQVADVELGYEVRRGSVTAGGRGEAVLGLCFLTMGENSKTVSSALRAKLDDLRPTLPADVEVTVVYDRTELVTVVIETVRKNLFEAGLLVVAVLFLFLGNLRAAFIVALAIPVSMLFAFTGMWRFGIAASLLSLGALDFGMVVDSSVVMVENCVRHIAHGDLAGRSKREVVRDAAVEVRKPTLFGELIIMIVYLPILTLEGIEGKLFRPMALTVIFALVGSMVLSMTLMPVLASYVLPRRIEEREPLMMRLALALYRPVLRFSMAHPVPVFAAAAGLLAVVFGMIAPHLGSEFVPKLSEGAITMNVVRLAGTDLAESNAMNTAMERLALEKFPDEVKHAWSRVGTAEVATDPMGTEITDLFLTLHPRGRWTRAKTQAELVGLLEKEFRAIPGQKGEFSQPIEMRMNEMTSGVRADLGVKLYGDDFDVLTAKAAEIQRVLDLTDGSADVRVEQVTGQPVLQIRVRQDEIARYGVPAKAVTDVVRSVGTLPVAEVVEGQLRFPLIVRLPERWRATPEAIGAILVATPSGERVPLSRLADLRVVSGPNTVTREWGQRRITITSNIRGRDMGSFVAEAKEQVAAKVELPKGRYRLEWGGQFENYERARDRLTIVVPVAVVLIFVLLYFTYHNLVDALRVFTGVPFGWVGGIVALWLRDMPLSISAIIGFIALSGVAVLDDMILVSYVRQLRQKGVEVHDAIRQASLTRLRPVLMTTLVASLGFLPMAFSTGQGAEVQRPLATVVIGGVIGAMVMSLLVLRVLYLVFDAAAHALLWVLTRVFRVGQDTARGLLGLDVEAKDGWAEDGSRNGSAGVPGRLSRV